MAEDFKNFLDVNNFVANSFVGTSKGLLKSNKFIVEINKPFPIPAEAGMTLNKLMWNAAGATVSNQSMQVYSHNINTTSRHFYKMRADSDLQIVFIEDANLSCRQFFTRWMRQGYDVNTLRRGYNSEIIGTIYVFPLNAEGQAEAGDAFYEAFPTDIASMDYSFFNEDVMVRTSVTFKFKWHDMGTVDYVRSAEGAASLI